MENKNTDRLIVIHNPNSTRADRVGRDVFDVLHAKGEDYIEHVTQSADAEDNIRDMTALFTEIKQQGKKFTVLSAAGDGTYAQAVNAALESGADVTLGSLHEGNFGDVTRMHKAQSVLDVIYAKTATTYPLTVEVDNQHWRYAPAYVTLGWTAIAAAEFGEPESRARMKAASSHMRRAKSLGQLLGNYFMNGKTMLPPFQVDGSPEVHRKTTDIMIANNPTIGRIVKFPTDYSIEPDVFGVHTNINVSDVLRSGLFAVPAMLGHTPHDRVSQLRLLFEEVLRDEPVDVWMQGEGEAVLMPVKREIFVYKNPKNVLPVLDARLK